MVWDRRCLLGFYGISYGGGDFCDASVVDVHYVEKN